MSYYRHSCRFAGVGLKSSVILSSTEQGNSLSHSWFILGPLCCLFIGGLLQAIFIFIKTPTIFRCKTFHFLVYVV